MPSRPQISRRAVLRGVGVTVALPWLEALPLVARGAEKAEPPKRFAALFMGNGISPKNWSAKGRGAEMELSKSLEPLKPFREKLNVISGLFNRCAEEWRNPPLERTKKATPS